MPDLLNSLFRILTPLGEMSLTAAYAAAVVVLLRFVLKKRAPKQVLCLLWLVVFARLLIPVNLESPLSIVPDQAQVQAVQDLSAKLTAGQTAPVQDPGPAQEHNPAPAQTAGAVIGPNVEGEAVPLFPTLALPEGAAPNDQPQTPAAFPWQGLAAGIWLAGAAAMCLYALASYLRLKRRLYDAIRAEDGAWEHPSVTSPFILGVLRPRVYLPAGLRGMPRQFILCHERAHLRRLDHVVKPLCWLALAFHWFNPAVWLAFVLMSRDIEAACDEAVIRQLGPRVKADYSATLLSLATNGRVPAPCPLAFDEGDAKGRIQNVLRYRRPALWIVVVSAVMAVMAAVCLLTDPVSAEEPGPAPGPSDSQSQPPEDSPAPIQPPESVRLDPWMAEVLSGERAFLSTTHSDPHSQAFTVNDLRAFYYGDQFPEMRVAVGSVAIIDLDRDGVNELVICPDGASVHTVGYVILRRQGDAVYAYHPVYRGFRDLKSDGTFSWSGSAAENGSATMSFGPDGYISNLATYQKPAENRVDQLYFVDGQTATWEEFEAATAVQYAKPEPVWYVYENGQLKAPAAINVPIPLDDYALAAPVPDFLDEEQQLLYRQMYSLYGHIFGANTEEVDNWPGHIGYGFGDGAVIERDGGYYVPATGLYANWADFEQAVLSVFTQNFWNSRNGTGSSKLYINEGGTLYYQAAARGSHGGNPNFPETFRLVEKTDDTISFTMTGYYSDPRPYYGSASDAKIAAWLAAGWESSIEFPMRMVKTENGWRFDQFYYAATDNFFFQEVPNPDAPVMDDMPEPEPTPFQTPTTVCSHGLEHAAFRSIDGLWELYCTVDGFAYTRISSSYYYSMLENWDLDGDGSKEAVDYTKDGQIVVFDVEDGRFNTYNFDPTSVNRAFRENCSVEIIDNNQNLRLSYEGQSILAAANPDFFLHYDSGASEPGVYRDQTTYALGSDGLFRLTAPVDLSAYGALETPAIHWTIRYTGGSFQTVPGSFQFELLQ